MSSPARSESFDIARTWHRVLLEFNQAARQTLESEKEAAILSALSQLAHLADTMEAYHQARAQGLFPWQSVAVLASPQVQVLQSPPRSLDLEPPSECWPDADAPGGADERPAARLPS